MIGRGICAFAALLGAGLATPASAAPFDNWAAMVVAGDWHAHSGDASPVFDNARRDLVKALEKIGFTADHIQQYSARPDLDPAAKPYASDRREIETHFKTLTAQATGGCFVYFTSHGVPLGIIVGGAMVGMRAIGDIIDAACPGRPAVIVVSACYSGMFIPVLHADNRMIVTASRADRTSFGCGEANEYTFFDQCVLETLPAAPDFPGLAHQTQACVAAREMVEGATPPSEPQVYIGPAIANALPPLTPPAN